ncbi:hypothetical protein OG21DRAFT_1487541 [Imleria badia]|nr:hypothetical protein OG21DRAFT_1487541 [Imleria badia]
MSSKNPFRNPPPPMQQDVILAPPSPPLPPLPQRAPSQKLPALPPPSPGGPSFQSQIPASSSHASGSSAPPDMDIDMDIDTDDLPPPYTPAANIGEETVGLGPRRPFQPPPVLPSSSLRPPPAQQSNWSAPSLQSPPVGSGSGRAPWQTQQQYRQRQKQGGGLIGALFDTVRDIAGVVSGTHDERLMASRSANAGAYAAPYPNTRPVYAPPQGPPQVQPPPPPRPASAPPQSPPPIPDDGSPTQTPVPGHPLLLDGNLLVYSRDHLCVKCKNTGYKNYDPSTPCRKCWDKYGKPYTGALTYTPWSPSGNDPRMQRPLPKVLPPQFAGPSPGLSSGFARASQLPYGLQPPPSQHPQHSRSISQPHYAHSEGSGPSYYVTNPLSPWDAPPVPDAIPVGPGDPRLGGRLCMRCGGAGMQTLLFIDVTTCDRCGGTGRVWM